MSSDRAVSETKETSFIYSPHDATQTLAALPHLRNLLPDVCKAGSLSIGFPEARKFHPQIFRLLANTHYDHIQRLLDSLDFCAGHGYLPPRILKRPDREGFESDLAEARLAEHLLHKEFAITDLEGTKGSVSVPEFLAHGNGLDLAVEVYTPRTRLGIDLLMSELKDPIKNLDTSLDFRFDIKVEQLSREDSKQNPLWLHPTILAQGLEKPLRDDAVAELVREVVVQLDSGVAPAAATVELPDLNIGIRIALSDVQSAKGDFPHRIGWLHDPPLSGYAPEAIFRNLVKRRVSAKLRKGQAPKSQLASLSLLGVDMGHSNDLLTTMTVPSYRSDLEATLARELPDLHGYDFVVLYEPGRDGLVAHFLITDGLVSEDIQEKVFQSFDMAA